MHEPIYDFLYNLLHDLLHDLLYKLLYKLLYIRQRQNLATIFNYYLPILPTGQL